MNDMLDDFKEKLTHRREKFVKGVDKVSPYERCGRVSRMIGTMIEVTGLSLPIGYVCRIHLEEDGKTADGEVISFTQHAITIMPYHPTAGIIKGALVTPHANGGRVKVGYSLLGRVVDGLGDPIDGKGDIDSDEFASLTPDPINPLDRERIQSPLDVGVRAINALMSTCKGQRMGIFAEAGLGKSVLLGMMTKFSMADVVIVGLIGERGREVKEFIDDIIGEAGLQKTVVVASPADTSPLMKVASAHYATTIAEYFRDQGKNVLLIIDSMTRYAQAHRQMALMDGEMPTAKGYTPTVFSKLSQLVERSGNGKNKQGTMTAYYTVLTDGEELIDPISEHMRSLLDGHIILSRELAEEGHFPAINIEKSISRLMNNVVDPHHQKMALLLKRLISAYYRNKEMVNIGMYQPGTDPFVDAAVKNWETIRSFLTQTLHEKITMDESLAQLTYLLRQTGMMQ